MAMAARKLITAIALISAVAGISDVTLGRRTVEETAQAMINVLSQSNVEDWSGAFISVNDPVLGKTLPATLFIPSSNVDGGGDPRKLAAYHIVTEHLRYSDLLAKKDHSLLPTLLQGFSIILSNSSRLTLNGVEIIEPDVFVDSVIAIHRVASPLVSEIYGGGTDTVTSNWKTWALISITAVCIMLSVMACCFRNSEVGEGRVQRRSPRRRSPRSPGIFRT